MASFNVTSDNGNVSTEMVDIKTLLNNCKSSPSYTKLSDLREEVGYRIVKFERVNTCYGDTIMVVLEGQVGDDFYLRVYLPRRFNTVMTDRQLEQYNSGVGGPRIHLVKRTPAVGSKFTPLEFV